MVLNDDLQLVVGHAVNKEVIVSGSFGRKPTLRFVHTGQLRKRNFFDMIFAINNVSEWQKRWTMYLKSGSSRRRSRNRSM